MQHRSFNWIYLAGAALALCACTSPPATTSPSKNVCVIEHLKEFNVGAPDRAVSIAKADGTRITLKSDANGRVVMPEGEVYNRMSAAENKRFEAGECKVE